MTVCSVILVAIGIWLIRSEGEKNREVIQKTGNDLKQEIRDAPGNSVKTAAKDVLDLAGQVLDAGGDILGGSSSEKADTKGDSTSGNKGDSDSKQRGSGSFISDAFNLGEKLAKTVDDVGQEVLAMSVDDEKRIGGELHKLISKQHKVLRSGDQATRLNRLAKPLVQRCKRQGIDYTFTVLDSSEINAFSHVGGYIYVNKGLLEFIDGDGELEFVLGHEIGHVELQHCTRNLTYAARASKLGGQLGENLTQIAYHLVAVGYSEDQEFAADEWGYRQLIELGRDQEQALALPRRFMEKEKREGRSEARPKSKTPVDAVLQEIDNHFRTHPPATERLEKLQRLEVKSGGRRDGRE
jgi:predicted Zn-dependent protease